MKNQPGDRSSRQKKGRATPPFPGDQRHAPISVDLLALLAASLAIVAALTGALHDIRW